MIFLLFFFKLAFAAGDTATSMVPRGKLVETFGRDFIVKTKAGTKIEIEFSLDGKFEEAFGKNLNKGDDLEPGDGLISLSSAAHHLSQKGHPAEGYWMIEKDEKLGWIYEFQSAILNAKTGEIIRTLPKTDALSVR